jgi:hypothetical protein
VDKKELNLTSHNFWQLPRWSVGDGSRPFALTCLLIVGRRRVEQKEMKAGRNNIRIY